MLNLSTVSVMRQKATKATRIDAMLHKSKVIIACLHINAKLFHLMSVW